MDTELQGKGVLVTGGAGGIGSAVVRAFAGEGAKVAVHFHHSQEKAAALAREVGGTSVRADLTVEADVDALVPLAVKDLGRLDVLVCNTGVYPAPDEPVWTMSLTRWRRTLAENLDSVFLSCRAFLRHVETTGTGTIVIISSTAGLFGEAGHADYAAAKGALASGFVKSLKNELRVVVTLASDRISGHVTGEVVTVAGGMEGRVLHEG
ncbi:MAG: SDR family NAD(P)-dependent oxidoreductase [Myxococcaceae bacterium]|nr:MAG: SDR family NAD(P)-dependent oxidoreductase [Myxococcaceae bacterium]